LGTPRRIAEPSGGIHTSHLISVGLGYVLTNPVMPGSVKIGCTESNDAGARIAQLYTTGVPVLFKIEFAARVEGIPAQAVSGGTALKFDIKGQVLANGLGSDAVLVSDNGPTPLTGVRMPRQAVRWCKQETPPRRQSHEQGAKVVHSRRNRCAALESSRLHGLLCGLAHVSAGPCQAQSGRTGSI
jgi:hypothetical protein